MRSSLAEEPVLQFIEGLRQRGYYDITQQYLDDIAVRGNLPEELRVVLPYERARTLLAAAAEMTNQTVKRRQIDAAQAAFEEFVKASPNHPLAGQANDARGDIFLEKAKVEILDGDKASNEGNRETYREKARGFIVEARKIFQQAHDQHEAIWKAFPTYIPEEDQEQRTARDDASARFITAQIKLAQCTYYEAQTYDRGSTQRKDILIRASGEFEGVHTRYRSDWGGLLSRLWQGKCFEEQDEIGIALGLYGEILDHPGRTSSMVNLKDLALRFRLICLNHEQRKDYQLVEKEATAWLSEAGSRSRTEVGLGIQWELCRAQELLGQDRNLTEAQQKQYQTLALGRARGINRDPGELKSPSSAMIQRLMLALNRDPGTPKDFDSAYGQGGQLFDEINATNEAIRKLTAERKLVEAKQQQQAQQATASEMSRMYDIALKLARPDTDSRLVNIAMLRLAYGYMLSGKFLDAAALADYQMVKMAEDNPETAREAGFVAMAALQNAYYAADSADRDFESRKVREAAERLAERWPDSDRANDARDAVAKIHWDQEDYLQAAEWWQKIPAGTSQYADAQIRGGNAYWRKYVLETARPETERAPASDLTAWKEEAIRRLQTGLDEIEKAVPDESPLPDDFLRAKLTLANIRNLDGIYQTRDSVTGALELLTQQPHPITAAVDVPAGQQRPQDSTKATSRETASFAYQQLLRTYIGLKNLDEARKAREKLEQVAGGEDAAALTQVYVAFGQELQMELERLQAAGQKDRLEEVRTGFEGFLNDLYSRPDGQTFYSMLWIAETYASLADGSADNPSKASEFFGKAASTYRSIIEKATGDPLFGATDGQVLASKLRLVSTLRRQKNFEEADTTLREVLKSNPNAPDAQFEAARLYQDWAAGSGADDWKKYETALYGIKEPINIWGWNYTAQSLQRAMHGKGDPRFEKLHFDARYNLADSEFSYGKVHPEKAEAEKHLQRALSSITGFQRLSKRWPDDQYQRFNGLYRQISAELGGAVVDLPRELKDRGSTQPTQEVSTEQVAAVEAVAPVEQPKPEKAQSGDSNLLLMLAVLAVGGGAVAMIYYVTVTGKKPRVYSGTAATAQRSNATPMVIPSFADIPAQSEPEEHEEVEEAAPAFNFVVKENPARPAAAPRPKPVEARSKTATATDAAEPPRRPAVKKADASAAPAAPRPISPKPVAPKPGDAKPAASKPAVPRPAGAKPAEGQKPRPAGEAPRQATRPPVDPNAPKPRPKRPPETPS